MRLSDIRVDEIMGRHVQTCRPEHELAHVERLMQQFKVRRVPVVDAERRIVGVVSLNDIAMAADRGQEKAGFPTPRDVTHTLASICSPNGGRRSEDELRL